MMHTDAGATEPAHTKPLKRLIITQVVIAGIACAVLIWLALTIPPLIRTKARLEADIAAKQHEIEGLEEKFAARRRELDSAERALRDAVQKLPPNNATPQALQNEIGSQHALVRAVNQKAAYVIVLASYKGFARAMSDLPSLQAKVGERVRLLYSISDYFVPAIGPIETRREAEQRLDGIRPKVQDAFVFTTDAFPYEINLATEPKSK
jgi:hypothetical protein